MEYTGLLELGCQKGNLNGFNTCVKDNCFFVTQHFPTQTRKVGERRANCCVIILYTIQGNVMLMQLLMLPCKVKRFSQCIPDPHSNVKFNWCTLCKPWTLRIYICHVIYTCFPVVFKPQKHVEISTQFCDTNVYGLILCVMLK